MGTRILVCDDEAGLREMLGVLLRRAGYEVELVGGCGAALERLGREPNFDLVITDLAILGYHEATKRMEVIALHPGVALEQVQANTGFAIEARQPLERTTPPSERELEILRDEVDPHRYIIGRGGR